MRSRTVLALTIGLLTCSVQAQVPSPSAGTPAAAPRPLATRGEEALLASLRPYPPPDSDEGRADLAIVLWLQRTRSAEDVARSRGEVAVDLETFAPALGPGFDPAQHPRTRALLHAFGARVRTVIEQAKERFARPRPFLGDPRVVPIVARPSSYSYPSGHAALGVVLARALGELAPARRGDVVQAGLRIGYDRVVGGVHYPSDVLAGQQLGEALADALMADPGLRGQLELVRASEWRSPSPNDTVPRSPRAPTAR